MTYPTINTVRDRVIALCETIVLPSPLGTSHAYKSEQECSWSDESLPVFVVEAGGGTDEFISSDTLFYMKREYIISLYVAKVLDESYQVDTDKKDLVNDCIMTVRGFFAARPTLSLAYDPLVEGALLGRDIGPKTLMTKGSTNKYHGTVFRLAVAFTRRVEQTDE